MARDTLVKNASTDSLLYVPYANVKGSEHVDSLMKASSPKVLLAYYDSVSYHHFDTSSYVPSVFAPHQMKPRYFADRPFKGDYSNWPFFVLFFLSVLYVYMQVSFSARYTQIKRAFVMKRYFSQLVRDGNIFRERVIIPVIAVYLGCLSLFVFSLLNYGMNLAALPMSKLNLFLLVVLVVNILHFAKSGIVRFLSNLFFTRNETEIYLLNQILFAALLSLFLLPMLWLYVYSQQGYILVLAAIVYFVLYMWRLLKAVLIWMRVFTSFKLFLYLCTLEILPFVIIAKAIMIGMKRLNV